MIKRNILALFLAVGILGSAAAQDSKKADDTRKMIFGLKAGCNFSWFKPDSKNLEKGGMKLGFAYGIMGDYNFQPNYSFAFEFLISNLNGTMRFKDPMTYLNRKTNDTTTASSVRYYYSDKYVQIPVSIKFRTKEIGMIKYYAQFGLAPAVRISSKTKIDGVNLPWSEDDRKGIKTNDPEDEEFEPLYGSFSDDVRLFNIPLIIGGGIEYNLSGNTSAYVNLRYENGFTNVLKASNTTVFSKNISLSAGVFF